MLTPEQRARKTIDRMLLDAGWIIQDPSRINLGAAPGVTVREYHLEGGDRADYILFVNRIPAGVIEAKKEGVLLVLFEEQAEKYARAQMNCLSTPGKPRFTFESRG